MTWTETSKSKFVLLTTFKKDGTPVGTPVWVAPAGGRPTGEEVLSGSARILDADGTQRVRDVVADKYGLIGKLAIRGHKLLRGAGASVGIAIEPKATGDPVQADSASPAERQMSARSSSGTASAWPNATTVPKAGEGNRPVSILRSVSGEIPAARATSVSSRSARAARRAAPRRRPASICAGVNGRRTMRTGYGRRSGSASAPLVLKYRAG